MVLVSASSPPTPSIAPLTGAAPWLLGDGAAAPANSIDQATPFEDRRENWLARRLARDVAKSADRLTGTAWDRVLPPKARSLADALMVATATHVESSTARGAAHGTLIQRDAAWLAWLLTQAPTPSTPHRPDAWHRWNRYALQPWLLREVGIDPAIALARSIEMAWEVFALQWLDSALDGELLDLVGSAPLFDAGPLPAVQQALDFDLALCVTTARQLLSSRSPAPAWPVQASTELTSAMQAGYWSLAKQHARGVQQLSVPPQLRLGDVDWSDQTDRWHRLCAVLESTHDAVVDGLSDALSPIAKPAIPITPQREVRAANDPRLAEQLEETLQQCRLQARCLGLVVVRPRSLAGESKAHPNAHGADLAAWQAELLTQLEGHASETLRHAFTSTGGELALVFVDLDRSGLTQRIRPLVQAADAPAGVSHSVEGGLIAGLACVEAPTKSFRLTQLMETAWRCLAAADKQGPGAVKGLEVY